VTRAVNQAGIDLVEAHEGLRLTAYKCPAGIWTIGYGHTNGVKENDTCTPEQAVVWLENDLIDAEKAVEHLVTVPLTDNQFAALVSFVFNIGAGKFAGTTLLRKLNERGYAIVPAYLKAWIFGGGKQLPGLVARRAAEAELWAKP
jgi:lysozyme